MLHQPIKRPDPYSPELRAFIAKADAGRDRIERACRITDRLIPKHRAPHGWDDPQGFVSACQREGERRELFREVLKRLQDKAAIEAAREEVACG